MSNFVMSSKSKHQFAINMDNVISLGINEPEEVCPSFIIEFEFNNDDSMGWMYESKEDRDSDYDYLVRNYVTVIPNQSPEIKHTKK